MRLLLLLAAALAVASALAVPALAAPPAVAQRDTGTVAGPATVFDGDRIDIGGRRIRLSGIDAPEPGQTCADATGRLYACGREAEAALAALIGGRSVTCTPPPEDRSFPAVALCRAGEEDLGAVMVAQGFAVADRLGPSLYAAQEEEARRAGRGIWRGSFTMPWDLRAGLRGPPDGYANTIGTPRPVPATAFAPPATPSTSQAASPAAPCRIKGNITSDGSKLYWVPGSRRYAETVITESTGERWFCTEDDAKAAGWSEPQQPFGPNAPPQTAAQLSPQPAAVAQTAAPEPTPPPAAAESGCRIKGNITRDGSRLYWVPGSRRYAETVITESTGERWFCTEDDAKAAGWSEPQQPFGPNAPPR